MTVKKVPENTEYVCDGCGKTVAANSRPNYWSELRIRRDHYDFQGAPVADASVKRDLCQSCTEAIVDAVNVATEAIRARSTQAAP